MPGNAAIVNHLHNTKPEVQSHATYPHSGRSVGSRPSPVGLRRVEQQWFIGRIHVIAGTGRAVASPGRSLVSVVDRRAPDG